MTVFVVDDDADHRTSLCDLVSAGGYEPIAFSSAQEALDALSEQPPELILTDLRMPGMDGIALITALRNREITLPVVMLTGHGDVALAVQAIRAGAEDFLEKPYDADHLLSVMERALRTARLRGEVTRLQGVLDQAQGAFIGESSAMQGVRDRLARLAPLDVDVVLTGETGTGKELAAQTLHRGGARRNRAFVTVDCATPLAEGFEEALFGAPDGPPGQVLQADGGTLFLDQIDLLPMPLQPRLLRLLESRRIPVAGQTTMQPVDIRVIASSTQDLRDMVRTGAFREDLFYRLAGVEQSLPPLRAMPADIPNLFAHFVAQAASRHGHPVPQVSFGDRKRLQSHHWPGNIRELKSAAERFVLGLGTPARTATAAAATLDTGSLPERVAQFEAMEIARVLDLCGGNATRAAAALGIPKRTLNAKIARSGLRDASDPDA